MNGLGLLVVTAAASVWVGQWISLRAAASLDVRELTPRLRSRLVWWGAHRTAVGAMCLTVAAGGMTAGILTA